MFTYTSLFSLPTRSMIERITNAIKHRKRWDFEQKNKMLSTFFALKTLAHVHLAHAHVHNHMYVYKRSITGATFSLFRHFSPPFFSPLRFHEFCSCYLFLSSFIFQCLFHTILLSFNVCGLKKKATEAKTLPYN